MATIIPPMQPPAKKPEPQAKKPEQIPIQGFKFWYMEMTRGTLKEATDKYLKCIDQCYQLHGQGKPENKPGNPDKKTGKKKRTIIPLSRRRESYKRWKVANRDLRQCLLMCEKEWYETIVNLLGQKRENLPDDILNYILQFLTVQKGKKKKNKKSNKKEGGKKTRRKKGTKRKRKRSRKRRKSKKKY